MWEELRQCGDRPHLDNVYFIPLSRPLDIDASVEGAIDPQTYLSDLLRYIGCE